MRTCALALRVQVRHKYMLSTCEKPIVICVQLLMKQGGDCVMQHGGRRAQRGDGATRRARARSKHLKACASSEASARGQKCVFRLHGLLQTGACGPAKGCCPIHKCGADAAVVCTPPQPRGTTTADLCNHLAGMATMRRPTRSRQAAPPLFAHQLEKMALAVDQPSSGQHQRRRRTCWRGGVGRWSGRCSTSRSRGLSKTAPPNAQPVGLQLR